jgi:hypothetical protein
MLVSALRRLRNRRGQFSLGGVKGGCCCATNQICLRDCGIAGVAGATIQLFTGATLVESHATDGSGCATFSSTGTFTVKSVVSGSTHSFGNRTLSGGTIFLTLGSEVPTICCSTFKVPTSLTLTDALGTLPCTYYGVDVASFYHWSACRVLSLAGSSKVDLSLGTCHVLPSGTNPVMVCYDMLCDPGGGSPFFFMLRTWGVLTLGASHVYYSQDTGSGVTCQPAGTICDSSTPSICGNVNDRSSDSEDPTSTSPFAISFTMTPEGGNLLADPVGGNVSVSA